MVGCFHGGGRVRGGMCPWSEWPMVGCVLGESGPWCVLSVWKVEGFSFLLMDEHASCPITLTIFQAGLYLSHNTPPLHLFLSLPLFFLKQNSDYKTFFDHTDGFEHANLRLSTIALNHKTTEKDSCRIFKGIYSSLWLETLPF